MLWTIQNLLESSNYHTNQDERPDHVSAVMQWAPKVHLNCFLCTYFYSKITLEKRMLESFFIFLNFILVLVWRINLFIKKIFVRFLPT
jgi:hypothetical protein